MSTWKRKQIERKKKDTCLILYDAITPVTSLLVSEIKMAAKVLQWKVSDVLQGIRFSGKSHKITLRLGNCLIKVRIYCLLSLNLAFFNKLCDFLNLCNRMLFEVNPNGTIPLYQMACQGI